MRTEWRKRYYYDTDHFGSGTTYPKGRLTKYQGNWDTDAPVVHTELYQYSREGWTTRICSAAQDHFSRP